jgi:excinuclease UvrABC nuclease subunit
MFKTLKIETEEHLRLLQNESKSALFNSIQNVHYPTSLRGNGAISNWSKEYKEIDKLNKILLKNISNKAGVYSLFTKKGKKQWDLLYIGQTQSKTARQRVRSHIVWRNKKTKSGQITGSQFDEVQKIIISGKELGFSFVEIHPAPLRHYIEENLIEDLNPPWNKHKTNKKQGITMPLEQTA